MVSLGVKQVPGFNIIDQESHKEFHIFLINSGCSSVEGTFRGEVQQDIITPDPLVRICVRYCWACLMPIGFEDVLSNSMACSCQV